MHDLISVIVPIYNVKKYLVRCIDSIIDQTYKNIEILLIDDGSYDGCSEICDSYSLLDNRVKVIHKSNGGVSSARNAGLDIASGKYVAFIDPDDYVEKTYIDFLFNLIDNNNADLSICGYVYEKEDGTKISITKGKKLLLDPHETIGMLFSPGDFQGYLWNKLFKMEIIDKLRFNTNIYISEDTLFVFQYLLNCNRIVYNPVIQYHYIYHENSALNSRYLKFDYKCLSELDACNLMLNYLPDGYKEIEDIIKNRKMTTNIGIIHQLYFTKHEDKKLIKTIQGNIKNDVFSFIRRGKNTIDKIMAVLISINPVLLFYLLRYRESIKKTFIYKFIYLKFLKVNNTY